MVELRPISDETLQRIQLVPELASDEYMIHLLQMPDARRYFRHLSREWWLDDECLGLSGFHNVGTGCVEIWCILTPAARRHPREFVNECKRQCDWVAEALDLHRLQATTRKDYRKASNLMDRLGFQIEGTLRSYRKPGEDYLMWGKLLCR